MNLYKNTMYIIIQIAMMMHFCYNTLHTHAHTHTYTHYLAVIIVLYFQ